jgi:hypothetical protein
MFTSKCLVLSLFLAANSVQAFTSPANRCVGMAQCRDSMITVMEAQKKKRKRKKAPDAPFEGETGELTEEDLALMKDVASFEFKPADSIAMGTSPSDIVLCALWNPNITIMAANFCISCRDRRRRSSE